MVEAVGRDGTSDLWAALRERRMSPRQWLAVWICVFINVIDGYEILAAGFTAPAISEEFGIPVDLVGLFLSASPFGMIFGAMLLSPLADLLGRRVLVLGCLLLATVGMICVTLASGFHTLLLARLATGIGVGAMMVTVNTVVAEASSERQRDLALVLQATGFPLGGAICGFVASAMPTAEWRAVYIAGAIGAACLLPLVLMRMPESLDFLLARRPANALAKVQSIAATYRLPFPAILPPARHNQPKARIEWRDLASVSSLLICSSYFLMMLSFYFLVSWAPKLLMTAGTAQMALSGAALISAGGVAGDLVFAGLVMRWRTGHVGPAFAVLCLIAAVLLTLASETPALMACAAFGLGFFLYGTMASHYAVVPFVYPASVRASGTGLAVGVGRVGAACGPLLGGLILSQTSSTMIPTILMTAPILACGALLYGVTSTKARAFD